MIKKIELLAPGGDVDSIKAAILAGADAVYCGLNKYNARNRATNIIFEDLNGILRLAHCYNCKVFITLNIIIVESEIPDILRLLNKLVNTSIDGIILQDLGLFYLISKYFSSLKIHASTQLTTHNSGQIRFLAKLNATRVNLSRELDINEITRLSACAHENNVLSEVFVHGSYCISFSGICYMSTIRGANSANRGRCSQPCRDQYKTTFQGKDFPLNLKDNSAFKDLKELSAASVDSIKIEGRVKKFHYVYMLVSAYKKQLQKLYDNDSLSIDDSDLFKVFNRDLSNGFLRGDIHRSMFVENPRDNSAIYLARKGGKTTDEDIEKAEAFIYKEKGEFRSFVRTRIDQLSISKAPITIIISGRADSPLKVELETPDSSCVFFSELNLEDEGAMPLDLKMILKRFKALNETEYYIEHIKFNNFQSNLYLPFNELTSIKNRILHFLKDSKETYASVVVPDLRVQEIEKAKTTISILISSSDDLYLCDENTDNIYYQLPNNLSEGVLELLALFDKNRRLIPWFPSILIGDDYSAAIELLHKIQAGPIVTNNSGVAMEAYRLGIPWIAGPFLNLVNSYSLVCLQESFNCCGAFVSNEISRHQIKSIKKPVKLNLYYSIYHPIVLMTSRQCLFQQVSGCEKDAIDDYCIGSCSRSASISNMKGDTFIIDKRKGEYNCVYYESNFLNTEIVSDMPDVFASLFIDLRDIKTDTIVKLDKLSLIKLFENHLNGDNDSKQELHKYILRTNNNQYRKGL